LIGWFKSLFSSGDNQTGGIENEFGTAIIEVALETVRQDMPANSLLVGEEWFRKDIDEAASEKLKSSPVDQLIRAWWTDFPIYFSLNDMESKIDVIALEGDPELLKKIAEKWTSDFRKREYEDIAEYNVDIQLNPTGEIAARYSLKSDYPRQ